MKKTLLFVRIISFILLITFISSCSSSSYTERYESGKIEKVKSGKDKEDFASENFPDETDLNELNSSSEMVVRKFLPVTGTNKKKQKFLYELSKYINVPYKYGGNTKSGIDCSAFTRQVYKNSLNVNLPRTAREQYKTGERIKDIDKLKFGDLIYFNTSKKYFPGHVGIYLANKLFVHASSSKGVIVSSLENSYYANRFIGASRIKVKRKRN